MNCELVKGTLSQVKGDIAAIGLFKQEEGAKALKSLDGKLNAKFLETLRKHLENEGFKGKVGEIVSVPTFGHLAASRILILGLGPREAFKADVTRKVCAQLARRIKGNGEKTRLVLFLRKADKPAQAGAKAKTSSTKAL